MARPRRPDLIQRILDAGEAVLIRDWLTGAQMSSIAEEAAIGLGTIYYYFASREDLLSWVITRGLRPAVVIPDELPLGPPEWSIEEAIGPLLRVERYLPRVYEAIDGPPREPIACELTEVVNEFCEVVEDHDRVQTIVEVCARDHEEIRRLWYIDQRRALVASYSTYFRRRIESGHLCTVDDPEFTARWLIDTTVLFLRYRHLDYYPNELRSEGLRERVVGMVVNSILGSSC